MKKHNKNLNAIISNSIGLALGFIVFLTIAIFTKFQTFILVINIIYIFACLVAFIILHKAIFTYFTIDNCGIKFYYKDKIIEDIKWSEIYKINKSTFYMNGWAFELKTKNKNTEHTYYINYNKIIKSELIKYCPNDKFNA